MSSRSGALFVGRLVPESGIGTLLDALDLFPGCRLDVVGMGPEEARVRCHPAVGVLRPLTPDEMQERMEAASYLVVPGATGALPAPRPVVEAFAAGLPVIACARGPLAGLIEPGRNGLLFEPGSARELARRLAWAEAFPERMRRMGECAKADYQARFVTDWSYQSLFGERRRAARL